MSCRSTCWMTARASPPEMLEQVFEPFFRLDEARSPHTGGSGLGLSIARSMACRNGGELSLHNRPEGGLCARLCLYRSAMETESL
ncbi:ATP-binding protein [Desulfovibrio piger]|uniref:ATP-binding protein n=1 Tax=Desulfovibrio piger TaxID=901 RepID=UPI003734EE00